MSLTEKTARVPVGLGLLPGFSTDRYLDEVLLRCIVLEMLFLGAVTLLVRVSASFYLQFWNAPLAPAGLAAPTP